MPNIKVTMKEYYQRARAKRVLDAQILACQKCKGLNQKGKTEAAVGYGNLMSNIMVVGQSLCTQCMETGIPFTEGSGHMLDRIFAQAGLRKWDLFITNVVHCHPPKNRPSKPIEVRNCQDFLAREILILCPDLIITLGADAASWFGVTSLWTWSRVGVELDLLDRPIESSILAVPHPAYFSYKGGGAREKKYIEVLVEVLEDVYAERGAE